MRMKDFSEAEFNKTEMAIKNNHFDIENEKFKLKKDSTQQWLKRQYGLCAHTEFSRAVSHKPKNHEKN